jgi:hypothetical protein
MRFYLTAACEGQPNGFPRSRFSAGTYFADTTGNAQPGDLVWPSRCANLDPNVTWPADAAAQAAFAAIGITATIGGPHPQSVGTAQM